MQEFDLQVQQALGKDTFLSVSYLGSLGREMPNFLNVNIVPCSASPTACVSRTITVSDASGKGPIPAGPMTINNIYTSYGNTALLGPTATDFTSITEMVSNINSNYGALVGEIVNHSLKNIQFDANYTWSHGLDYAQNALTQGTAGTHAPAAWVRSPGRTRSASGCGRMGSLGTGWKAASSRPVLARGLKMTGQRRVIARVLSEAADHPDVEEVYRRATRLDAHISIATVYRTVRLLEEKGILERRDFGGGRARYEPTEHGHHYHLIDVDTGRVLSSPTPSMRRCMQAIAERLGFDLVSLRLELFGRRKRRRQAPPAHRSQTTPTAAGRAEAVTVEQPHRRAGREQAPRDRRLRRAARRQSRRAARRQRRRDRCRAGAALPRLLRGDGRACPSRRRGAVRRDRDDLDAVADHLLVIDHALGPGAGGRGRHLPADPREAAAERIGRFYTADEFDICRVIAFPGNVLELGRSCVDAAHRSRVAMQLLWRGIAAYVFHHRIDLMFGCASLPGTDAGRARRGAHLSLPPSPRSARPCGRARCPARYVEMRRRDPRRSTARKALVALPPLIKGYLRLGGFVGDGAVIDRQFNTTDVASGGEDRPGDRQILPPLRAPAARRTGIAAEMARFNVIMTAPRLAPPAVAALDRDGCAPARPTCSQ